MDICSNIYNEITCNNTLPLNIIFQSAINDDVLADDLKYILILLQSLQKYAIALREKLYAGANAMIDTHNSALIQTLKRAEEAEKKDKFHIEKKDGNNSNNKNKKKKIHTY
eukprot:404588_1